tara:strand:+ start:14 stop:253 length:240 start_codon:yes stop_codon:yes gene_type:complete
LVLKNDENWDSMSFTETFNNFNSLDWKRTKNVLFSCSAAKTESEQNRAIIRVATLFIARKIRIYLVPFELIANKKPREN